MPNVPPRGWHVEVDHPDRDTAFEPDVIADELSYTPAASEQPTLDIPVRQTETWLDDSWDGQDIRIWKDGTRLPLTELARPEVRTDKTILHCVGGGVSVGDGLRQRVSRSYESALTVPALRDLVTETTDFAVETLPVPVTETTGITLADVDTQPEWNEWAADALDEFTPVVVENGSARTAQTCYLFEGEDPDFDASQGPTFAPGDDSREWSDYGALVIGGQLNGAGEATWKFTPQYSVPTGDPELWIRLRTPNGTHDGFDVRLDGESPGAFAADALEGSATVEWKSLGPVSQSLTAGEESTIRMVITDDLTDAPDRDDGEIIVDQVAVADNTYDHKFDEWGDNYLGNGVLQGPALYPEEYGGTFSSVYETIQNITEATITTSVNETGGAWDLGLFFGISDDIDNTRPNTDTVTLDPGDAGRTAEARPIFNFTRYPDANGLTPRDGARPTVLNSFDITVDVDSTPLLLDRNLSGELADVLTRICREQDLQWELQYQGGTPTVRIGRAGTGDTRVPEDLLNWSVARDKSEVVEAVRVRGGSAPVQNEQVTPQDNAGTPDAELANDDIIRNSELIRDATDGTEFTRGDDYLIDYEAGTFELTGLSDISFSEDVEVDYQYKPSGEFVAESATAQPSDFREVDIPSLSSPRPCGVAARLLVEQLTDPLVRAEATVSDLPPWFSVFDTLDIDALPEYGRPYDVSRIAGGTGETTIALDSREEVGEEVAQLRAGLGGVEDRV